MKWYVAGMIALMLVITGCSSNQQEIGTPAKQEEKQQTETVVNAEELIRSVKKTFVASHSMKLDTTLLSTVEEGGTSQKEQIRMVGDLTLSPDEFHASVTAAEEKIEMYLVNNAAYVRPDGQEMWFKMSGNDTEELSGLGDTKEQTVKFLDLLLSFKDDLNVTDEGDVYNISYETTENSDEIEELIISSTDGVFTDGNFALNSFRYDLSVRKDSHELTENRAVMDLALKDESGAVMSKLIIDTYALFSDFNKIDKIVVPQEIVDSATEIPSE
ncbi:DUF6612 family protein [Paenibacillus tarimensis]|uniref:DUF6612 family protein n=1 Tax=Paenibacillus tarimensis TaxID=416012 RepID=UPI001F3DE158|nr:DUF6612 family protein [Paenibacillus tarimensis]MCF2943319.1 hypothetical protein [Paenibacillus tarimensis]